MTAIYLSYNEITCQEVKILAQAIRNNQVDYYHSMFRLTILFSRNWLHWISRRIKLVMKAHNI